MMLCTHEGCKQEALYSFTWPWGQEGAVCADHRLHVNQKLLALGRPPINFVVLDPGRPQPISRDERTQLRASLMTAEEDLGVAQARAAVLYTENQTLREEARRQRARLTEVETQLKERKADIDNLVIERDAALADAGEAQQEVAELQGMLPRTDPPPAVTSPPLESFVE